MDDTLDVDIEKDDNKQTESAIGELTKLQTRTPEQEQELKSLQDKSSKQGEINKRLGQMREKQRMAELRAYKAEAALEEARAVKSEPVERKPVVRANESIAINGKQFFTDAALRSKVEQGEMTQDEAWEHQQERIEEKAVARVIGLKQQDDFEKSRQSTVDKVLDKYPQFNPKHPEHDPQDPLYKEASRLLDRGYKNSPTGLWDAIEDAKKILRLNDQRPDISEELNVSHSNIAAESSVNRSNKVVLSDEEKRMAVRLYVMGGTINPATGRVYNEAEAIAKSMKAKQERQALRR